MKVSVNSISLAIALLLALELTFNGINGIKCIYSFEPNFHGVVSDCSTSENCYSAMCLTDTNAIAHIDKGCLDKGEYFMVLKRCYGANTSTDGPRLQLEQCNNTDLCNEHFHNTPTTTTSKPPTTTSKPTTTKTTTTTTKPTTTTTKPTTTTTKPTTTTTTPTTVPTTTTPQYFFGFHFGPFKIEPPCETDCHFGIQLGPEKKK